MKAPKVQRAWALNDGNGDLCELLVAEPASLRRFAPVLVIPEAAVKGCKHPRIKQTHPYHLLVCEECGAWSEYLGGERWSRWQRPAILRVARGTR